MSGIYPQHPGSGTPLRYRLARTQTGQRIPMPDARNSVRTESGSRAEVGANPVGQAGSLTRGSTSRSSISLKARRTLATSGSRVRSNGASSEAPPRRLSTYGVPAMSVLRGSSRPHAHRSTIVRWYATRHAGAAIGIHACRVRVQLAVTAAGPRSPVLLVSEAAATGARLELGGAAGDPNAVALAELGCPEPIPRPYPATCLRAPRPPASAQGLARPWETHGADDGG